MRLPAAVGGLAWLALAAGIAPASVRAETAGALQPFQMVRSLQLVQDRIAAGDHAALPMQRKLLEMVDRRMRESDRAIFVDPRNFRALLVYAMSGGNPVTIEVVMSRLELDDQDRAIGDGVLAYLRGQPKAAQETLAAIDPMSLLPELGAFLALVKGSVITGIDPQAALRLMDQARLLGPGTLVEEAALRRALSISINTGDAARFLRMADQYVRAYLHSPYASQFADLFVSGAVTLHASFSLDSIHEIAELMDPDQEKVIYLRIARRAAIDGLEELSAFAAAKAAGEDSGETDVEDPRALLYASLSSVTSGSIDEVLASLGGIDRAKLSPGDRDLLDAVVAIAAEVTGAPPPLPDKDDGMAASRADAPDPVTDEQAPAAPDGAGAPERAKPPEASAEPALAEAAVPPDPTEAMVASTRQTLKDIDKLLEETPR
ncbi:MAG: chemotaxis protein MotC [Pseudaminobacter sp.]|nr:chemotaxis protein MotC [Pseudaminobacter sp.]